MREAEASVRSSGLRDAARGVGQAFSVVGLFVAAGLALAGVERSLAADAPGPRGAPYPVSVPVDLEPCDIEVWLVDGFNVLNAAVLRGRERAGFWRAEARERLLEELAGFGEPERLCVVFDGPAPGEPEGKAEGPQVVFAPSADEWLLRRVRSAPEPGRIALVTADRQLADRARHRGAQVVKPREFLARCRGVDLT